MVNRDDPKSDDSDDFLAELNELLDDALDEKADPTAVPSPATDTDLGVFEPNAADAEEPHDDRERRDDLLDWADETPELELDAKLVDCKLVPDEPDEWKTEYSADDDGTVPLEAMWDEAAGDKPMEDTTGGEGEAETLLEESWTELELESEPDARASLSEDDTSRNPVEEPLSYAARVAAASFPEFRTIESKPELDNLPDKSAAEVDSAEAVTELSATAASPSGGDEWGDIPEDIETDAETDLLDAGMALDSTEVDELDELDEFEMEPEAAPEAGGVMEPARMPFDVRQPTELEKMILAPAVPVKRSFSPMDLVKVLLALVMLAFTTQMGMWWGLGSDPIGLARVAPSWLLPNQLKMQAAAAPSPSTPPGPSAPTPSDVQPEPRASVEIDTDTSAAPETDTEPPAAVPSDLADAPAPEATPTDDQDRENKADNSVASNAAPPADAGLNSGLTEFEADRPEAEGTDADLDFAEPTSEDVAATEPDTLLEELDAGASSGDDQSNFDAALDSQGDDLEAAPELVADEAGEKTTGEKMADAVESAQTTDNGTLREDVAAQPAVTQPRPLDAPIFSPDDLASAVAAARDADTALTSARVNHAPDLVKKAEQFYRSFATLAVTGTYVDREGADQILTSARDLLSSFEFDEKKQRMIANAAGNWIKAKLGDGVLAAVTVTDLSRKGELFEVKASLMGKEAMPITLLTSIDPGLGGQSGFTVGDRILVLGTVVHQPERKIDGYSGAADMVIWFTDLAVAIP